MEYAPLLSPHHDSGSVLGRLDPRAKIVAVIGIVVASFFSRGFLYPTVLSLMLAAGLLSAGVSGARLWAITKSILLLSTITILFHVLFADTPATPGRTLWGITISATTLARGGYYALRLALYMLAAFFLLYTTTPTGVAEAFVRLGRPMRSVGLPVDDLGLVLSLTLRFVPILVDELLMVRRAQELRGFSFAGNLVSRVKATVPLLVPVFVSTVMRADTIALAIESRGYVHGQPRSYFSRTTFGFKEWVFVAVSCATVALLLYLERRG